MDVEAVGRSILGSVREVELLVVPGYEARCLVARGGMGQVWHGVRLSDGREVALKVNTEEDPEMDERLAIEAEMLRGLRHPHIVGLLDFILMGEGDGVLVMEWIDGPNLASQLPERGFDFEDALRLYFPVLEAVGCAHGQGVIHRDIKPSNILLTAAGVPKVSDFGLARSLNQRRVAFSMTRSGAVAGTVEYLAPECYLVDYEPSKAADIYALGVLLYEMLSGTPPRGAWLPLSQVKSLDVRLDELITDMIHPDPARRVASVGEVRERLEGIRGSRPRLSGTPLVTPAVRLADLGWTVLGLYVSAAGFCATLSQTNTPVPALLDLRLGSKGLLIAGFLAVWVLSIGIGVLSIWQMMRLWRFRHVPLREALPQPFGARLGRSRMAAFLVTVAQFFIFALPPLFTVSVAFHAFHWLSPETAVWQNALVVTPWRSDEPVSPWLWEPAAFFDSGRYWLKQAEAGFIEGRLRVVDRTSFFVFVQPAIMVLAGVVTSSCGLMTFWMAVRQWWPRRRGLLVLAGLSGLTVVAMGPVWRYDATRMRRERASEDYSRISYGEWRAKTLVARLQPLFDGLISHGGPLPAVEDIGNNFIAEVGWLDGTPRTPQGILEWAEADGRASVIEGRTAEEVRFHDGEDSVAIKLSAGGRRRETFEVPCFFLEYTRPRPGRVRAVHRRLIWSGTVLGSGEIRVKRVAERVRPCFEAELRGMDAGEAERWLTTFLEAFCEPGCPALETFFNDVLFSNEPIWRVFPARDVIGVLRKERAGWQSLGFSLKEPMPGAEQGTGGWRALRPKLQQEGTRVSGKKVSGIPIAPKIDVAWVDGAWRIVRFSF